MGVKNANIEPISLPTLVKNFFTKKHDVIYFCSHCAVFLVHPSNLKELLTRWGLQRCYLFCTTLLEMQKMFNSTGNKPSATYFYIINHFS